MRIYYIIFLFGLFGCQPKEEIVYPETGDFKAISIIKSAPSPCGYTDFDVLIGNGDATQSTDCKMKHPYKARLVIEHSRDHLTFITVGNQVLNTKPLAHGETQAFHQTIAFSHPGTYTTKVVFE